MHDTGISNEAIAASAGSGKTYQLALRYIRLVHAGVRPDRIAAFTFARKAASEIFDSVVERLCASARDDAAARNVGGQIGAPDFTPSRALAILRDILAGLHRLHVGTLDSFVIGVVRAFPSELGVSPAFRVFDDDGAEAASVRERVLARIFDDSRVDAATQERFHDAFRQATFGSEEKGLLRSLSKFLSGHRKSYAALPDAAAWGARERIWPAPPWWDGGGRPVAEAAAAARDLAARRGLDPKVLSRIEDFANAAAAFAPGSPWDGVKYLFAKLAPNIPALRDGAPVTLSLDRREVAPGKEERAALLDLMRHIVKTEIERAIEQTQGIFRVLEQFERSREGMARRQGELTFQDAQFLLTGSNRASGGALLSRARGEARLYIDYRLDCELDHWLLDEFQDTSDPQWDAVSNLVDEVLQDTGGRRSFFYVGDVKQAIYGWRGGNARLFGDVLRRYGDAIRQRSLTRSFRCCPQVICAVNRVFADLRGSGLPAETVSAWEDAWQTHEAAAGRVPAAGHVALVEPPCDGGALKPDAEDRYGVAAAILRHIDPVARGLSAALLVRTNDQGKRLADYLRRACPGMTVVHEGRASVKDNPVVGTLLALAKFAAHPGDTMAWHIVRMGPLRPEIETGPEPAGDLPRRLLASLRAGGFRRFVAEWGGRLAARCPLDAFGAKRLRDLLDAAGEFDEAGGSDVDEFLRFVENYSVNDLAADSAVRVMTVHQSKGLGFDVVLLPELAGDSVAAPAPRDFVIARARGSNRPAWAMRLPRAVVCECDDTLAGEAARALAADAFEELCVLYVAMTRARRGLYAITSYPGPHSEAITPGALLKLRLADDIKPVSGAPFVADGQGFTALYEDGSFDAYPGPPAAPRRPCAVRPRIAPDFSARPSLRSPLQRVRPSAEELRVTQAGALFADERRDVLDFGTAIHELFEKVGWIEEADADAIVSEWLRSARFAEAVRRDACEQFRRAMLSPEVRLVLARPAAAVELWREKSVEVVIGSRLVSAKLDRVVVERDSSGRAVRAGLLDYKSDRVSAGAAMDRAVSTYRPQVSLYARALSLILDVPLPRVRCDLVFTRAAAVRRVRTLREPAGATRR